MIIQPPNTNLMINSDSLTALKELPDNSVDSVVTDPPYGLSFMGKKWDYDVPSIELWKEVFRVMKPGAFLLSFAGTRTYHRMAVNIEDAGFEIRDMISWLYGSGFPKSLNIGKQVDKMQGNNREVVGENPFNARRPNGNKWANAGINGKNEETLTKGTSEWEGWGTALKPACEPIVVARKPLSEKNVASNVLKWGTGGINIDACRIGASKEDMGDWNRFKGFQNSNTIRKNMVDNKTEDFKERVDNGINIQGRFPANIILDEEAGKLLDEQAPQTGAFAKVNSGQKGFGGEIYHKYKTSGDDGKTFYGKGLGGASRFFKNITYTENYLNRKELDKLCYENIPVKDVEKNLATMNLIDYQKINSVQRNVLPNIISQNQNLNALFVEKNVANIEIDSVQELVQILTNGILEFMARGQSFLTMYELTQVQLQGIIILNQNLVFSVVKKEKSDIMRIIQNLKILFGCVEVVMTNTTGENCRFRYVAKAGKKERNLGCEELDEKGVDIQQPHNSKNLEERYKMTSKNNHPTVKPVKLMQYLVRLVTKKGGLVLDPFFGSGTTGIACIKEGMNYIGIEREADYIKIANARIKAVEDALE